MLTFVPALRCLRRSMFLLVLTSLCVPAAMGQDHPAREREDHSRLLPAAEQPSTAAADPAAQPAEPPAVPELSAPATEPAAAGQPVLALIDFETHTVEPDHVQALSQELWRRLVESRRVLMLPREETRAFLLQHNLFPFTPYREANASPVEICRALRARYLATGTLERLGEAYLATLTVYDAQQGKPVFSSTTPHKLSEAESLAGMNALAGEVLGAIATGGQPKPACEKTSAKSASSGKPGKEVKSAKAAEKKPKARAKVKLADAKAIEHERPRAANAEAGHDAGSAEPRLLAAAEAAATPEAGAHESSAGAHEGSAAEPTQTMPAAQAQDHAGAAMAEPPSSADHAVAPEPTAPPIAEPAASPEPTPTPKPAAKKTPKPTPTPVAKKADASDAGHDAAASAGHGPAAESPQATPAEAAASTPPPAPTSTPAPPAATSRELFDKAMAMYRAKDYAGTVQMADQALKLNPRDAMMMTVKGSALYEQEKLDEARAAHAEAIATDPNNLWARYNLALTLTAQNKEGAADAWREYLTRAEKNPAHTRLVDGARQQLAALEQAAAAAPPASAPAH